MNIKIPENAKDCVTRPRTLKEIVKTAHPPKTKNINVANSVFMMGVEEEENIVVVTSFNSKESTYCNGIDMDLI